MSAESEISQPGWWQMLLLVVGKLKAPETAENIAKLVAKANGLKVRSIQKPIYKALKLGAKAGFWQKYSGNYYYDGDAAQAIIKRIENIKNKMQKPKAPPRPSVAEAKMDHGNKLKLNHKKVGKRVEKCERKVKYQRKAPRAKPERKRSYELVTDSYEESNKGLGKLWQKRKAPPKPRVTEAKMGRGKKKVGNRVEKCERKVKYQRKVPRAKPERKRSYELVTDSYEESNKGLRKFEQLIQAYEKRVRINKNDRTFLSSKVERICKRAPDSDEDCNEPDEYRMRLRSNGRLRKNDQKLGPVRKLTPEHKLERQQELHRASALKLDDDIEIVWRPKNGSEWYHLRKQEISKERRVNELKRKHELQRQLEYERQRMTEYERSENVDSESYIQSKRKYKLKYDSAAEGEEEHNETDREQASLRASERLRKYDWKQHNEECDRRAVRKTKYDRTFESDNEKECDKSDRDRLRLHLHKLDAERKLKSPPGRKFEIVQPKRKYKLELDSAAEGDEEHNETDREQARLRASKRLRKYDSKQHNEESDRRALCKSEYDRTFESDNEKECDKSDRLRLRLRKLKTERKHKSPPGRKFEREKCDKWKFEYETCKSNSEQTTSAFKCKEDGQTHGYFKIVENKRVFKRPYENKLAFQSEAERWRTIKHKPKFVPKSDCESERLTQENRYKSDSETVSRIVSQTKRVNLRKDKIKTDTESESEYECKMVPVYDGQYVRLVKEDRLECESECKGIIQPTLSGAASRSASANICRDTNSEEC